MSFTGFAGRRAGGGVEEDGKRGAVEHLLEATDKRIREFTAALEAAKAGLEHERRIRRRLERRLRALAVINR